LAPAGGRSSGDRPARGPSSLDRRT